MISAPAVFFFKAKGEEMSQTAICNRALALLGANRITSISDETPEARSLANVYEESLRSILSECDWNFALKREMLNRIVEEPVFGKGYYFQLPSDLVRIFGTDRDCPWRIEGDRVLAESDAFGISYVYMCRDDNLYTSSFIEAFACKLAYDTCFELTNNGGRQMELLRMYKGEFLPIARNMNARDRTPAQVKDDYWVKARFTGYGI